MGRQFKDWNNYGLSDNTFLSLFLESNILVQVHETLNHRKRIKKLTNKVLFSAITDENKFSPSAVNTSEALLSSLEGENYGLLFKKEMQIFYFTAISDDAWSELLSIHD